MTITLTDDVAVLVAEQAARRQTTPDDVVADVLRGQLAHLRPPTLPVPQNEWEARLLRLARPCGVSLSDEAVSSEGLYD